jgi:hypothetical protein
LVTKDPNYNKKYYNNHKEYFYNHNKEYYKNNKEMVLLQKKGYHNNHKEEINKHKREYRKNIRDLVLLYYSDTLYPRCNCCKITQKEFLCIDHINGNGAEHRKTFKGYIYLYLIKNGFPEGYQILCNSCNRSKGKNQCCIHHRMIQVTSEILTKKQIQKREYYKRDKIKITKYYSKSSIPFCKCCGENELEFLEIDHLDGHGREHRKKLKSERKHFFNWLQQNNFPDGYQILCSNCNMAKGIYGKCPHENQKFISTKHINNIDGTIQ